MPSVGRILERLTVAVDGDTSGARRELHGLSDESSGGSWIGKMGGAAAKAGGLMAVGIGAGAAAMGGLGLAAAANAEQSTIAFTSIMGDAGKAKAFLADLNQFAATTPFELPGLRDAASRLLATGTEAAKVIPIMRAVGDSTSAMGTGAEGIDRAVTALTQMQVKGKITGEEMLQLAEAGVPAWDALATVMGVSVAEAQAKVSAGQGNVNDLFKALETQAGPAMGRVKGMMDAQSASAIGMVSTFKDVASQGLGEMMGPALIEIKKMAPAITETLGTTLALIGPQVSGLMTGLVGFIGDLLPAVAPLLGAVAGALGDTFKALGPALAQLGPPLLRVFQALLPVLPAMANGLAALIPALIPLINGFARLLEIIPPNVLAALVAGFVAFGPVTSILGALAGILPILGAGFTLLLGPVGLVIAAAAALAAAGYLIYRNWDTIAAFFDGVWDRVTSAFSTGVDATLGFFTALPGRALDALKELPFLLGGLATAAVRGLLRAWWTITFELPKALFELAPRLVSAWWDMQQSLYRVAWDGLVSIFNAFAELPGWLVGALVNLGPKLARAGWEAMQAMWKGIVWIQAALWDFFVGLPGQIGGALVNLPSVLWNAGRDAVMGLWNGLVAMGGWLKDKVWGWIKDVLPDPIKRALGIASPSTVMAWHGRMAGLGFADGILDSTSAVVMATQTMVSAATTAATQAAATQALLPAPTPVFNAPYVPDMPAITASPGPGWRQAEDGSWVQPGFYASSRVSAMSAAPVAAPPPVFQLPDGSVLSMDEVKRRMRVLFIDDGGRNAFTAATG